MGDGHLLASQVGTSLIISFVIIIIVFFLFILIAFPSLGLNLGPQVCWGNCLTTELCSQLFKFTFYFEMKCNKVVQAGLALPLQSRRA